MTHARNRVFYEHFGVPDSVMGRFDMLAMHVYLLTRRLAQENKLVARELSQDVFDLFVEDIERALRQIGKRSMGCHSPALELAEKLAASDDKTARWIGRDAVKELTAEKTLARLASKGNKRQA